jgi:hypothetical protein
VAPRVLFCLLAREDLLGHIVLNTLSTWILGGGGSRGRRAAAELPSVFFFVSEMEMATQSAIQKRLLQSQLAKVKELLKRTRGSAVESDSTLSRRRLSVISSKKRADQFSHTKRYFKRFFNADVARHELKQSSAIAEVGPNLAPPVGDEKKDGGRQQQQVRVVRLLGLKPRPMSERSDGATAHELYYKTSLSKPTEWHNWLREKVKALTKFLVEYSKPLGGHNGPVVSSHFSWFVVLDDDTYVKLPQFLSLLGTAVSDPESTAVAIGRKFVKLPTVHMSRQPRLPRQSNPSSNPSRNPFDAMRAQRKNPNQNQNQNQNQNKTKQKN